MHLFELRQRRWWREVKSLCARPYLLERSGLEARAQANKKFATISFAPCNKMRTYYAESRQDSKDRRDRSPIRS
jgi:hypothetical protein